MGLGAVFALRRLLEELERVHVDNAREQNWSWQSIATSPHRARHAVVLSQDEAVALGHDFIGTEHILLGLVGTDRSTAGDVLREQGIDLDRARAETVRVQQAAGVVATGGQPEKDALSSLGIDVDEIKRRAEQNFGEGSFQFPRPAYTARAKRVLEQTLAEARDLGHEKFGTEHILLGLLTVAEGRGAEVLAALGTEPERLREAVPTRVAADASWTRWCSGPLRTVTGAARSGPPP